MQHLVAVDQIEGRAKAIGLNLKGLARSAGVHFSTVYRAAHRGSCNSTTLFKLTRALEAEEARVRGHLDAMREGRAA